jgi:hypothetical protein
VARIFVAYHSFAHCALAQGPWPVPAGRTRIEAFSANVSDVNSFMPYFVIPWLAIENVDWFAFPPPGPAAKALTCTDIS